MGLTPRWSNDPLHGISRRYLPSSSSQRQELQQIRTCFSNFRWCEAIFTIHAELGGLTVVGASRRGRASASTARRGARRGIEPQRAPWTGSSDP
ncbi:unnamed protein product [Urochloa humidicola]